MGMTQRVEGTCFHALTDEGLAKLEAMQQDVEEHDGVLNHHADQILELKEGIEGLECKAADDFDQREETLPLLVQRVQAAMELVMDKGAFSSPKVREAAAEFLIRQFEADKPAATFAMGSLNEVDVAALKEAVEEHDGLQQRHLPKPGASFPDPTAGLTPVDEIRIGVDPGEPVEDIRRVLELQRREATSPMAKVDAAIAEKTGRRLAEEVESKVIATAKPAESRRCVSCQRTFAPDGAEALCVHCQ